MANNKAFKVKNGLELGAISDTITDTAVDVFVYDTSKDSDGGAWRHRTQATSWYNETLNTATRGSRKEFPAVAVIVAESNQVTIYDGDDPDLPMWMVFNLDTSFMINLAGTTRSIQAVTALNGVMVVPLNGGANNGTTIVKFVEDFGYEIGAGYQRYGTANAKIADRNVNATTFPQLSSVGIVAGESNDVAMTVLPNAPIDAATGLPVPTIAVATEGGVSVIKDDGTVVDITHTASPNNGATDISFDGNQISYATQQSGSSANYWRKAFIDIPSADVTGAYTHNISGMTVYDARGTSSNSGVALNTNSNLGDATNDIKAAVHDAVGFTNKLTLLDVDYYSDAGTPSESGSMVAYASSTYNTGWMNGDIKLATLSDTDATNVTGSELVTNGDFASTDLSDWSEIEVGSGTATFTVTSGALHINLGGSYDTGVGQGLTTVIGETYVLSFDLSFVTNFNSANNVQYSAGTTLNSTNNGSANATTDGTYSLTFTATATTTWVNFRSASSSNTTGEYSLDNISVRLAEEDRSVNGNGLQVFGTVTKSAVATGADLVAYSYSSSSTSNYLWQPYNSDLAFGTGDFSVMFWTKSADYTPNGSGVNFVLSLDSSLGGVTGKGGISIASSTANDLRFQIYQNGYQTPGRIDCIDTDAIPTNTWNCICAVRRSGVFEIWLNGQLKATNTANLTADVSSLNTDGWHILSSNQQDVQMSLLRASATVSSPEQIKKIYEDERVLFQEGAQATLYGSSDAVTALAYDDSTDLLHVGTSAGRSDFQGLRRVNNTTTAVTSAISASNGLIVEQ